MKSKSRTSNLRIKIISLLLSLAALWAFAAFVTVREGLNLLWIRSLDQNVGRPTDTLVRHLQDERRLSAVALANSPALARSTLEAARRATDDAVVRFRFLSGTQSARLAATADARRAASELDAVLDRLPILRYQVDTNAIDRVAAIEAYNRQIEVGYRIFAEISYFDDRDIDNDLAHLLIMSRGRELLSQEDALLSGVYASGTFTATEATRFVEIVGAQRHQRSIGAAGLPREDADIYGPVVNGPMVAWLRVLEDVVATNARAGTAPAISQESWRSAVDNAITALARLDIELAEATIARATGPAIMVIVRLILAAGLGLVALIASIVVSVTTARAIVKQLRRLRDAAQELASQRLPGVVEKLRKGEEVDIDAEAPPLVVGDDEIGQVGRAFNDAQETAVRVAVEQAELRRSVRDVFVSLARRNQTLVQRQLRLLDSMECRVTDQTELDELFKVDQLATRMRRNAENLLVLSGATPGRGWRRMVPMVDAVRAAVAEVEEYSRVRLWHLGPGELAGMAVGDVVHLLAELIENGLSFSPPESEVRVGGLALGSGGYLLEIEDDGLGMSETALAEANEQLENPPEFRLTGNARLGLYVVARLAARHGMRVRLQRSPRAGTTARVLIPASLMSHGSIGYDPAERDDWEPVRGSQVIATARIPAQSHTPSGLPVRHKQPPDRSTPEPAEANSDVDIERSWRLMAAFQRGTVRGRAAAQQLEAEQLEAEQLEAGQLEAQQGGAKLATLFTAQQERNDRNEDNGRC